MTEREQYIEKAKAKLDQWNADIDKFKAKVAESDADAKIEFRARLVQSVSYPAALKKL
ncbi:hypothetical protein ROE7235_03814 [Roseibaca ekhonensis]|uniref:Uncharacterized protein n=1 Tax=Roseinatronobacter ekhonensis TaxID=254356 RepID=A0A3B0MEL7_9RHOB|nr:hypothetical protein [Roseibaca ekhonensis]SUZ34033.1 hypothetical protein ROE7235_03814 [Roseibaca ekhonensis]